MKKFLTALAFLLVSISSIYSQTGPPAPGTGIYALIDTTYDVGTFTQGVSHAKVTLKNTSLLVLYNYFFCVAMILCNFCRIVISTISEMLGTSHR